MGVNKININNNDSNYAHSIFDISEYTGKTYDTLSDALADVPDGKKKGGMTVSFVSTSDNKYVQYRLMSDSFNTTPSNWQGIDDEPTAGSNNLVKSGGVQNEISRLDEKLGETPFGLLDAVLYANGTIRSLENYKVYFTSKQLSANDKLHLKISFSQNTVVRYAEKIAVPVINSSVDVMHDGFINEKEVSLDYVMSEDAYFLCSFDPQYLLDIKIYVNSDIPSIKKHINELQQSVSSEENRAENAESNLQNQINNIKTFENAASYGFLPVKTAAENTVALNAALQGGNKTLVVTQPGTYSLNDTILIDDNTELIFGQGVKIKKDADYYNMFLNRKAYRGEEKLNLNVLDNTVIYNNKSISTLEGYAVYYTEKLSKGDIINIVFKQSSVNTVNFYEKIEQPAVDTDCDTFVNNPYSDYSTQQHIMTQDGYFAASVDKSTMIALNITKKNLSAYENHVIYNNGNIGIEENYNILFSQKTYNVGDIVKIQVRYSSATSLRIGENSIKPINQNRVEYVYSNVPYSDIINLDYEVQHGGYIALSVDKSLFIDAVIEKDSESSDITIKGLNLVIDNHSGGQLDALSPLYGLRGELAFLNAKNIIIEDFEVLDLSANEYGIHINQCENVVINKFIIKGEKDGIHISSTDMISIKNGITRTYDDSIGLCASDWASSNCVNGSITNAIIENVKDEELDPTTGYATRLLTGVWVDWYYNMSIRRGDYVVSNGYIYQAVNISPTLDEGNIREYSSFVQPTINTYSGVQHDSGGFDWKLISKPANYRANKRKVKISNFQALSRRGGVTCEVYVDSQWARTLYPSVPVADYPIIDNIQIENSKYAHTVFVNTPYANVQADIRNVYGLKTYIGSVSPVNTNILAYISLNNIDISKCTFPKKIECNKGVQMVLNNIKYSGVIPVIAEGRIIGDTNIDSLPEEPLHGDTVVVSGYKKIYNGETWNNIV